MIMYAEKKKIVTIMIIMIINLTYTVELFARSCSDAPSGVSTEERYCITFSGQASGGTLVFYEYLGGNAKCASIETEADEPAEKVIERLAKIINETNPFGWLGFSHGVTSSGGDLRGLLNESFLTAGTEVGLGIPQSPNSLTCNYKPETNSISLRWINPSPDAYDSIHIMFHKWSGVTLPGNSENHIIDLNKYQEHLKNSYDFYSKLMGGKGKIILKDTPDDLNIWVFGVRNDIPSNAAAIHVNKNIQQEQFGIPFTSGIAPNWKSWFLDSNNGNVKLKEGYKNNPNQSKNAVSIVDINSFYQVIDTGAQGGTGGVYRKFIGLTPGHTYRVKTRVATLSEPNEGQWIFSVHAAPNGPDGRDLSPRQMDGIDNLPSGNTAGRIALYDSSMTTKGKFVEISTNKAIQGKEISDITLPQGVDSITIWVKCKSSNAFSAAIDWIELEDLSMQII